MIFFLPQFFNINVKFDLLNRLVVYHKSIDRMSILSLHFHCSTVLLSWSCIMHLILDWLTECGQLTYSLMSIKAESNYCFLKRIPTLATHLKCWLISFRNRINERSSQFCLMDTTKYASYLLKLHCLEKYNSILSQSTNYIRLSVKIKKCKKQHENQDIFMFSPHF